jgi:hypothetical protein
MFTAFLTTQGFVVLDGPRLGEVVIYPKPSPGAFCFLKR